MTGGELTEEAQYTDREDPAAHGNERLGEPAERVTTLELFFDLVFVFTITQLTSLFRSAPGWRSLWHVAAMLGLIFYMYDGYAWLTNAVPARGARRQGLLLGGMAGYLVLAIAVPDAYQGSGVTLGVALLVITLIHAALYVRSASEGSSRAMRQLAPQNIGGAVAVLVAALVGGEIQAIVWTAVVGFQWAMGAARASGFEVGPSHFVERHGLLVIVAIGESVVAIGVGAARLPVDVGLVSLVVLGLALCAGLWWTYFGVDEDVRAEVAMRDAGDRDRPRMAIEGFGYGHYAILLGIILASVGIREAIAHPGRPLALAVALALDGGVAVYLAGDAWFRHALRLDRVAWRVAAAIAVLPAIPVATNGSAAAGLASTVALLGAVLVTEAWLTQGRARPGDLITAASPDDDRLA